MNAAVGAWTGRVSRALVSGNPRVTVPVFFLLAAFYGLTAAGNLAETDDAYAFAYRAENFPLTDISDPRLMLYHMLMRLLYLGASGMGLPVSGLFLMKAVAVFSAALFLIVMVRVLAQGFDLSHAGALITTMAMGVTHGFWRYSAEADVYVPALLLVVWVFYLLIGVEERDDGGWRRVLPVGVFAGLAVLLYQPNVVPLFFVLPLLLLRRDRLSRLIAYTGFGASVVVAGYVAGYLASQESPLTIDTMAVFLRQRSNEFMVPALTGRVVIVSVIKSAFAFSHDLLSANWIFGMDWAADLVQRVFPSNVIDEEIFTARQAGKWIYAPLAILPALAAVLAGVILAARPWPWHRLRERRVAVCVLWLAVYSAMVGRLNPAGIEAWIMVLLPLFLLLGPLLVEPCLRDQRGGRLLAALVGLMLAHNAIGGMALVRDPATEYDLVKSAWIVKQAGPDDLVIITDNVGLAETLRYRSRVRIAVIRSQFSPLAAMALLKGHLGMSTIFTVGRGFERRRLGEMVAETWRRGGRLIFFDEFFKSRTKDQNSPRRRILDRLRSRVQTVYHHETLGSTFILAGPIGGSP